MTTEKKANRANASTGPRTAMGKRHSRLNALKSGVYSKERILPSENGLRHRRLHNSLHKTYKPEGPIEELLVEEILGLRWQIERIRRAAHEHLERSHASYVTRCPHEDALPVSWLSSTDRRERARWSGSIMLDAHIPIACDDPLKELDRRRRKVLGELLDLTAKLEAMQARRKKGEQVVVSNDGPAAIPKNAETAPSDPKLRRTANGKRRSRVVGAVMNEEQGDAAATQASLFQLE